MGELTSSWSIAREGKSVVWRKVVLLAKENKRRLLKTISSVFLVMISCVIAYSPP
jgi:hypothetical protein